MAENTGGDYIEKRLFTRGIAPGLAAVMLAGCSGSGISTSQGSTDAGITGQTVETRASQGQEQTIIGMWYHISPDQATLLLQMIGEFQELHPGTKVETQSMAFAEIKKQLSIGVAADQLLDVTLCDTTDNVSFAVMGAAMDITSEVEAWRELGNYFEAPVNSARYEDRYYGVPYYSNCLAVMYNKGIFDEMGLEYPDSGRIWGDFKDVTAETTTADHYGLIISLIKSEEGTFDVLPFIWQAGADYDSLDSERVGETLTMINDFYQNGYMSKELISMTQADMYVSLFATGKPAMMVAGSWLNTNIQNENPDLNYGVVTFPNYRNAASPIGGGNIMMMKDGNREASWELMKFLSSKENSRKFCEDAGYISSGEDAVAEGTLWLDDPILSVYTEQLELAKARGPHPKWPEISSAIQFAYQDVLSGARSVDDTLKQAAAEVVGIINE